MALGPGPMGGMTGDGDTGRGRGVSIAVIDDGKANALTFEAVAGLRSALASAVDATCPWSSSVGTATFRRVST